MSWRPLLLVGAVLLLVVGWLLLQLPGRQSPPESSPKAEASTASSSHVSGPDPSDQNAAERFTFYETLQTPAPPKSEPLSLESKAPAVPSRSPQPAPDTVNDAPKTRSTKGYAVQVAAFRERPKAMSLINRLEKKGYRAYLLAHEMKDRENWYRVRLGPYPARAQAEEASGRLKREERMDSYIARLPESR